MDSLIYQAQYGAICLVLNGRRTMLSHQQLIELNIAVASLDGFDRLDREAYP